MADDGDPMEPVFRSNKRRKVLRRRPDSEDEGLISTAATAPASNTSTEVVEAATNAPMRSQKAATYKKHGIRFTSTDKGQGQESSPNEEMAVVTMHPSREQHMAQIDRFIKPTGKVAVVDDKHMVAYVDSKLAEMRSATATPLHVEKASSTAQINQSQDESRDDHLNSITQAQADSAMESSNEVVTSTGTPSARPGQSSVPRATTRSRPRPRRRPHDRDANDIARDSLVDQILQESAGPVPIYDRSSTAAGKQSHHVNAKAGDEEVDNDEAAANAFKAEFLLNAEQHRKRKAPAPPPQKGVAPVSSGPKLGGSRSQRERMKAAAAAEEASKAGGGIGVGKR